MVELDSRSQYHESVSCKHKLLGKSKNLRAINGDGQVNHGWSNVLITPHLTKEERNKTKKLCDELKKRKAHEKNDDLVIYRGTIIDKKEIKGSGAGTETVSQPVQPV